MRYITNFTQRPPAGLRSLARRLAPLRGSLTVVPIFRVGPFPSLQS